MKEPELQVMIELGVEVRQVRALGGGARSHLEHEGARGDHEHGGSVH